ncbi:MAG: glycosyltransferase family 4 protein [Candidatus Promineifilaceae bacterium]
MRIAYFSPLPPQRSGIADYSGELIPHLSRLADLTLFTADPDAVDKAVAVQYDLRSHEQFGDLSDQFDLALYHIGNSEYHDDIARIAFDAPGVIVLHDHNLHHAVALRTIGKGDRFAYAREMGYERGADGVRRAMATRYGIEPPLFENPLNGRLLDASLGVIVHSQYTARLVERQGYRGSLSIIPALIAPFSGRSRRRELNLPDDAVLFGSFGLISKEKQIIETLHALRRLRTEMPNAYYLLVGNVVAELPVEEAIQELGLHDAVFYAGYAAQLSDFVDWIHTADVVINLRSPTVGETSAAALRAMAAGKALIINDDGWYREIPSAAAAKIPPGDESALLDVMRSIGQSEAVRQAMGNAGRQYTRKVCSPGKIAEEYVRTLTRIMRTARIYG